MTLIKFKHLEDETIEIALVLIETHLGEIETEKARLEHAINLYSRLRMEENDNVSLHNMFVKLRKCELDIEMCIKARNDLMGVLGYESDTK